MIGGAALWLVTAVVTLVTENTNLIPTVILLGSFLVPFSVVLFVTERSTGNLDPIRLIIAFFVGGIFGVLGASILEVSLQPSWYIYALVGVIEEFVKITVFLVAGRHITPKTGYQGALLGATVGAGFAAFESAGYAFNAGLSRHGVDVIAMLQTEAVRSVLTPVGHVLWTAILGAAIFHAAAGGRKYKISWVIPGAFVLVALLHALWDSMSAISALLAVAVAGGTIRDLVYGQLPGPELTEIRHLSTVFYVVGLLIISAVGGLLLRVWARRAQTTLGTDGQSAG